MAVCRIPLDYLYYNDKNGRIATEISQYEGELQPANDAENPEYDNFVAKLIKDDNTSALTWMEWKHLSSIGESS